MTAAATARQQNRRTRTTGTPRERRHRATAPARGGDPAVPQAPGAGHAAGHGQRAAGPGPGQRALAAPSAVLDAAHLGDIEGALGRIRLDDQQRAGWRRLVTFLAIVGPA